MPGKMKHPEIRDADGYVRGLSNTLIITRPMYPSMTKE